MPRSLQPTALSSDRDDPDPTVSTEPLSEPDDPDEQRRRVVRYLAGRCGDRALAEDLTQDAILTILSRDDLRDAWQEADLVFRVTLNAWNNHRRKEEGRMRTLDGFELLPDYLQPNSGAINEIAVDVGLALERLDPEDRELLLDTWRGYSIRELCEKHECSQSAMKMRRMRARNRFGFEISEYIYSWSLEPDRTVN